ncbi:iron complex transport system substrate-binding protein [Herbihabitans rhizosphaerae]|uniref:Iron complex transport system substrate-binding protein n=1 Tax=Herbihabitans rhizosphaerae TaxID=1872711 RepID=A0A4Q7KLY8_9PSEU|nr:iron-siderophore ABC transporter substrate-binding protein [Herbihabitans rhizosphaerae]RZS36581.1 iron complex transport system substrate-binding protein [Herbihabitans rhizosphaerae]
MQRRSFGRAVLAVVAGLVLASCSGGTATSGNQSAGQAPPAQADGGRTFPVKVTHKYGTTEVRKADKIVTLGLSDHEIVLALGAKPVGVVDWFKERPFGKFPWQKAKWGDTEPQIVGERDDYNMERIIALQPDLIIAQYSGMKKEQYDALSRLFPVVAQPVGYADYAAPWQEMTRVVGRAMAKSDQAEALIKGIDDRYAAVRERNPKFGQKTIVVGDSFQPGAYAAFAAHDPKAGFMVELGFKTPPRIAAAPKEQNVVEVGSEGLGLFEADVAVWLTSSEDAVRRTQSDPLYRKLKVATEGRDLFIPYETPPIGAALSFGTVLSIPYAIDNAVPLLAKAVK